MRRRVYRSLDRTAAIFGIRGRFIMIVGAGAGLGVCLALIVGSMTSMLMGFAVLLAAVVASYFLATTLQSRIEEKKIWKWVLRRGYPARYRVRPKHIRNIWRGFNLANTHFIKSQS